MARYRTTVESTMSVEDAFDYLVAFDHVAEWDPGVARASAASTSTPHIGSQFEVVTLFRGREQPLTYAITALDRPHRFVVEAANERIRSLDEVTISSHNGRTEVTYDAQLFTLGIFRIVAPVIALMFKKIGDSARVGLIRELNR